MSGRPTTRTMRNGFSPSSSNGDSTRKIETFEVLFPTPKTRIVEMLKPTSFRAQLQEPPVADDPTSGQSSEQLPTYNAYSADGDVTAPLVYVNYGNREDYEELDRFGISVKGAIVIARYGHGWRGVKPKVAAEHGAIGCIIYSDPKGDGYYAGRSISRGRLAAQGRGSARQRHGYRLSGRPLDSGRRRNRKSQAIEPQGSEDHYPHSGAARSLMPMRCRCCRRWQDRSRRRAGAARSRSRTTSVRDRPSCI